MLCRRSRWGALKGRGPVWHMHAFFACLRTSAYACWVIWWAAGTLPCCMDLGYACRHMWVCGEAVACLIISLLLLRLKAHTQPLLCGTAKRQLYHEVLTAKGASLCFVAGASRSDLRDRRLRASVQLPKAAAGLACVCPFCAAARSPVVPHQAARFCYSCRCVESCNMVQVLHHHTCISCSVHEWLGGVVPSASGCL